MKTRIVIAQFLLAILVMVQLSVLHEFEHDDSSQHCEICIAVHDLQSHSFELQPVFQYEIPLEIPFEKKQNYTYSVFVKSSSATSRLSIRPPPAV